MKLGRANTYPGKCCICEGKVPAKCGFLVGSKDSLDEAHRNGTKQWLTLCRSAVCVDVFAGRWTVEDASRRELCEDGTIVMPYDELALPLLQSIAKATRSGTRWTWVASSNPGDRPRVLEIAERLGLVVHPSWLDVRLDAETQALVDQAEGNALFPYQIDGVEWLATRPRGIKLTVRGCLLADDPGLGKTVQVLHMVPEGYGLVVICPANAKPTWQREPGKWLPARFTSVHVCEGGESFRWPAHPGEIVVANYEITPFTQSQIDNERKTLLAKRHGVDPNPQGKTQRERLGRVGLLQDLQRVVAGWAKVVGDKSEKGKRLRLFRELALLAGWIKLSTRLHLNRRATMRNAKRKPIKAPKIPIIVALDEAHVVSNLQARRTENAMRLTGFAELAIGMTGTPVDVDPMRLYNLLKVCRCRVWDWDGFLEAFNGSRGEWGGTEFLREPTRPGGTARGAVIVKTGTADRLREVVLRREKQDVVDLPPKIFSEIIVPVTRDLLEQLDELSAEAIELILAGKIPKFPRMSETRKALELSRIPRMFEEIENYEAQSTPFVVFADHRAPIEAIIGRPGWGVVIGGADTKHRDRVFEGFQRGDLIGVAGTIGSMNTSATLTRGSHELFVGQSLVRARNKQSQDRCHRIGTKGTVNISIMTSDHPFDQHIADLLANKDTFVESVLNERMEYTPGGGLVAETRDAWLSRLPENLRARYAREANEQLSRFDRILAIAGR
jgi:hypothetical protein